MKYSLFASALLSLVVLSSSVAMAQAVGPLVPEQLAPRPFGDDFPGLDSWVTGKWWTKPSASPEMAAQANKGKKQKRKPVPFLLDVPRSEVIAFAVYTVTVTPAEPQDAILKLSTQLFPLRPGEAGDVRLEVDRGDGWQEIAKAAVHYPGWDATFRVDHWDATQTVPYRVRHGQEATFTGTIRPDPADKSAIAVAVMSCNSSNTPGQRDEMIAGLRAADPDLLFFAGDQTYRHTEHTGGWIEFGLQFRDIMRDRPTVTIPDDHDVGQANLWGAGAVGQPMLPVPVAATSIQLPTSTWWSDSRLPIFPIQSIQNRSREASGSISLGSFSVESTSPFSKTGNSKLARMARFPKWVLGPITLMTPVTTGGQSTCRG